MIPQSDLRERQLMLARAIRESRKREEMRACEARLIDFYRAAWPAVDASEYHHNWHLEAIAEHLEAVSYGWIRRLLINLPPRHSKTLLVSVAWNAWAWCRPPDDRYPLLGPSAKFMCLSYADPLAMDNAVLTRRLITSQWYQERWGRRVVLTDDQDAKNKFDTTQGGTRISASFKGTITGRGAGIRVYDDPHKMDEVESETIRNSVLRLYDTTLKSRITDPRTSAEVLIAQRGHQSDLSSKFMEFDDVVHLNLPAEYDSARHCVTVLKWDEQGQPEKTWEDPRTEDGQLLWPERFGPAELATFKRNPYEWQAQWQQMPSARGGGIIKDEWWQVYEVVKKQPVGYRFVPDFGAPEFVVASLDPAFGQKETNDYNALVVVAVITHPETKHRRLLLVDAWQKRLPLHGDMLERQDGESEGAFRRRQQAAWGVVEWVAHTCRVRRVDRLLIENKARGHDIIAELRRLYSDAPWGIRPVNPTADKVARAHSVVDLFADGMVYAPAEITEHGDVRWLNWADEAIRECSVFPNGSHDDLPDALIQALKHLREVGLAVLRDEKDALERDMASKTGGPKAAIYPV